MQPRWFPLVWLAAGLLLLPSNALAGTPKPWTEVPEAVRQTVLARGGKAGQTVDLEPGTRQGQAVYEASVKDAKGRTVDLVITADGKLVGTKTDDSADAAAERVARRKQLLAGVKFNHPREITHPFLPLARLGQDVLQGHEGAHKVRVERTARPEQQKVFKINGQSVAALVVEDRTFLDGRLEEVAVDYFAQDDAGNVYYLGEEVTDYDEKGKVKGHEGSWMLGKDTQTPGLILPAQLKVGAKFKSEDVSGEIDETDEVVALTETVTVPAGTYTNCLKIKETLADGSVEYKYYAPGVGVVREMPADGDEQLLSHRQL